MFPLPVAQLLHEATLVVAPVKLNAKAPVFVAVIDFVPSLAGIPPSETASSGLFGKSQFTG